MFTQLALQMPSEIITAVLLSGITKVSHIKTEKKMDFSLISSVNTFKRILMNKN